MTIANQVAFTARLALSVGFGPVSRPKNRAYRTAVNHGTRPVGLAITGKPVQQCEMDQIPNSVLPEPQPSAFGSIRQGISLRSTKILPARQARSVRRGRPPCGLDDGIGRRGSITSTTHQERARQPCEGPPTAIECRTCCRSTRRFCPRKKKKRRKRLASGSRSCGVFRDSAES